MNADRHHPVVDLEIFFQFNQSDIKYLSIDVVLVGVALELNEELRNTN